MIAFFQTGGIGDAILGTSIVRKLAEMYGDVCVLYCDHLVPQVYQGMEFIASVRRVDMAVCRTYEGLVSALPGVDFAVFNKFRRGIDGKLNFFHPISSSSADLCREYGNRYVRALSADMGREIGDLSQVNPLSLVTFFNSETDYFADWRRYGIGCGYGGVGVDVYPYTADRNAGAKWPEKFVVFHDSRLPVRGRSPYLMKAWKADRWRSLCDMVDEKLGIPIVQILSEGQEPFAPGVIPHTGLIGRDATFQDYLYLLSRASAYVGTDSWPAHAAIFIREPGYVLLKGAVSRRWDHDGMFSRILRIGPCQSCEGPGSSTSTCLYPAGHPCMDLITPEMVFGKLQEVVF
jgi:hypothetical protein